MLTFEKCTQKEILYNRGYHAVNTFYNANTVGILQAI